MNIQNPHWTVWSRTTVRLCSRQIKNQAPRKMQGLFLIRTSTPSLTETKRRYSANVTLGQSDSQSPQKKKPTVLSGRSAFPLYSCHRTDVIPEGGRPTVLCVLWLCQKVKLN